MTIAVWRSTLALLTTFAVWGCERPFVEIAPPTIEAISPDLAEVQLDSVITLRLRVTSLRRITRVEVNGTEAKATAEPDVFESAVALSEGTSRLFVDALDEEGNSGTETLFAVFLPLGGTDAPALALPRPLADHSASALADGVILVAGGFDPAGDATSFVAKYVEQGSATTIMELGDVLGSPRGGHTASLIPDGRVVFVGGATTPEPASEADFVTGGEIFDPASASFSPLPFSGEPIRRAFHTAATLTNAGRTFIYLYGGRGPISGSAVGTRSDVTVLEVRSGSEGDSLINLSPEGGIGAFPPVARHIQLPLPDQDGFSRTLTAGAYQPPGSSEISEVAFRFLYTPSVFFFPFEIFEEGLPPLQARREGHAGAILLVDHALIAGGREPGGAVLASLEVFSDAAGQFFRFPDSRVLRVPRHRHTATLLPSGRILILGGVNSVGETIATAELILPPPP